jgi:hypothetical protein
MSNEVSHISKDTRKEASRDVTMRVTAIKVITAIGVGKAMEILN